MLTNKGKYGLKALVHLARVDADKPTLIADIAKAENISKKFLDAILRDLKNAGFVRSWKGPGGGYALAKPAGDIMIGPVVRALDGPLAPIACASRTAFQPCDDCTDLNGCAVRLTMIEVRDAMAAVLDKLSLAEMSAKTENAPISLD
ncbi:RrF2 family transcriptional regulator [Oryzibacter oryziterrae]|uniref:RrF2 family transcriptional regulator n=1 Tax=Oryzibacter oryziterrae TaxID=2766474 RepID=UPI001F16FF08|nr:Rrf2 family transcriptional regulator [Oryzibacter oryziterrae]